MSNEKKFWIVPVLLLAAAFSACKGKDSGSASSGGVTPAGYAVSVSSPP